jgi:hypothetical protein
MTTPVAAGGRRGLLLSLGALAMTLLVPVIGIVFGVFALAVSVRSRSVAGIVISVVSLLLAAAVTATQLYFSTELSAYYECKKGAGTVSAEQQCLTRLERAMEAKLPFIGPGRLHFPFAP